MKTITVASLKGGCSKTTTAFSLAASYAGKYSTVAVDLDAQCSLSDLYQRRENKNFELIQISRTHLEQRLKAVKGFDRMVIDTPPATSVAMLGAIRAADLTVVCVRPGYSDYDSLERMLPALQEAEGKAVILLTQTTNTTLSKTFREGVEGFGIPILKNELRHRAGYAYCVSEGLSPAEYEKGSTAAGEWKRIVREIEDHL